MSTQPMLAVAEVTPAELDSYFRTLFSKPTQEKLELAFRNTLLKQAKLSEKLNLSTADLALSVYAVSNGAFYLFSPVLALNEVFHDGMAELEPHEPNPKWNTYRAHAICIALSLMVIDQVGHDVGGLSPHCDDYDALCHHYSLLLDYAFKHPHWAWIEQTGVVMPGIDGSL